MTDPKLIAALVAVDRARRAVSTVEPGREVSIARTKLEEARMWLEAVGR